MAYVASDVTESFIAECSELLGNVRKQVSHLKTEPGDEAALKDLLRDLHTIKGNARMLSFSSIEKLAHALEDIYKAVRDDKVKSTNRLLQLVYYVSDKIDECLSLIQKHGNDNTDIDLYLTYCDKLVLGEIIDIDAMAMEIKKNHDENVNPEDEDEEEDSDIANVQSIRIKLGRINEIIGSFDDLLTREFRLKHQLDALREAEERTGSTEISKIRKQFASDLEALETCIFNVQQQVFDLRMLPISMVLRPMEQTIEMESIRLEKNVQCCIPDTDIALDKVILEQLNDILMHLVRNALDHGLETPAERKAAGKSEQGTISITCKQETKHIELIVADDGRGIDFEKVRKKALALYPEKAEEIKELAEKELSAYLFMSGFSTKEKVTELSGRGVGLDVVRTNIERIKGKIRIESTAGQGTSFILTFPLSLATLQGLFVFSGNQKFMIPSQHVVDIVYKRNDEYINLQNQNYIPLNGQLVPMFAVSSLLGQESGEVQKYDADTILITEYLEQQVGIIVEEVQRYVSLVVKPLPKSFCNFTVLQGIVFDEHYAIVPILHVPDIITRLKSLRGYDIKKYEAKNKKRVYRVLVTDDSATTRQIEKSILENAGFLVDTAEDGIDGLEQMKKKQFDLIISDMEMPRMDGEVFLDNIRRQVNYQRTPVIIVSSVQDEAVHERFRAAGASAFIVKSDFKRGNLIATIKD
ncbi:MAG: response regulator, partial [Treponemataceae bacterium]|nr:response regulator [Treponemataceae bacterium]